MRFGDDGACERVWWPRAVERDGAPDFTRNYLQLNSIAAGPDLAGSCFSASSTAISARRPGHRNYPVDRRGAIFGGASREPLATGLTRPHSARFGPDGALWVDDSGYGRVGAIRDGRFQTVAQLPGWTRGLAFCGDVAFVGISRVIPRFAQYAPGLDAARSRCGVVALDARSGRELARIAWPAGNQVLRDRLDARLRHAGLPVQRAPARRARAAAPLLQLPATTSEGDRTPMSDQLRLLMIGAMYENGGNTTHRFLDGHPQLHVYPFESQLGTRHVNDHLASLFPLKYRWPQFALDATPEQDYRAIVDEEGKVRARTPHVSKFRHRPFDMDDDERMAIYCTIVRERGRSRAGNAVAFLEATFEAWRERTLSASVAAPPLR